MNKPTWTVLLAAFLIVAAIYPLPGQEPYRVKPNHPRLFIAPATVAIGDQWLVRFNPTGPIGGQVGGKLLAATVDIAAQYPAKPSPGR